VSLWVLLACRSVLEGFAAFDNISELERRVNELAPELRKLFEHMLQAIDPRYQQEAFMLLITCQSHYMNRNTGAISCLGLALQQAEFIQHIPPSLKREKCRILEGRLRSRCYGLLKIVPINEEDSYWMCFCEYKWDRHDQTVDGTVAFIHRTVSEFNKRPNSNACFSKIWNVPPSSPN
jgi:hypothetical protein